MITPIGRAVSSAEGKKDHLQAIGLITVNFAMLENSLALKIAILLGVEYDIGQMITSEQSFTGMIKFFDSLLQHKISDVQKIQELKIMVNRLVESQQKRNIVIHSTWAAGNSDHTLTRFKTTTKIHKGLRRQFEQTTVEDLNDIAHEISVLAGDLSIFMHNLGFPPGIR